jgi:Ser/Thr protein kinase RdoA (MazF antagonist)
MNQNPVVVAGASVTGVIVFVKALISLIQAMQWFDLTPEQWAALAVFFETTIPIVAVWVGAIWVMRNTTNLTRPTDIDGTPLTRPDNAPAIKEMAVIQEKAIEMNEQTRGLK